MVNISDLKKGDLVISNITNNNGLKQGQAYPVVKTGTCRWSNTPYADIKTEYENHTVEINYKNFRDFDMVS